MTRARNVHVSDVYVAGRQVVSAGKLTGVDFAAAEAELMEMARRAAPRIAADQEVLARHHSIIRDHYLERRHLQRRDG
jgi:hypothetical protein